jgi:hypothetical protein
MNVKHLLIKLVVVACCCSPLAAQAEDELPPGFEPLPTATDLSGWVGGSTHDPRKISDEQQATWDAEVREHWSVDGDELVSDGHGPHLVTAKNFSDFELWVDWKLSPAGDSGIYLRDMPQVQLWDPSNEAAHVHGADKGSGALWNNTSTGKWPLVLADKPTGEWNRMYVRMVGPYVRVILNDQLVVDDQKLENYFDRNSEPFAEGRIHLQTHGSETRFKRLYIRSIPQREADELKQQIEQR